MTVNDSPFFPSEDSMKHSKDIAKFVADGDFEVTSEGLLIHKSILGRGVYTHTVNGEDEQKDVNLIPAEGIAYILGVALGNTAKINTWYLALSNGNSAPAANWTHAGFTAAAGEITSESEGYTGNRPAWTAGTPTAGVIGDLTAKASFSIVCATSINITGAALLSTNTRGNLGPGVLVSASRFQSTRVVANADSFELGYQVELIDT